MNCAMVYGVVQNVTDNVKLLVDQYREDNSLPMFIFYQNWVDWGTLFKYRTWPDGEATIWNISSWWA